jgi:excisionase family DNA binding protein
MAKTTVAGAPRHPNPAEVDAAGEALQAVKRYLAAHPDDPLVRLRVDDEPDTALTVPRPVVELLAGILAHMAAGRGVSVVPAHAELTTQEAADMLNVSRPFLIGLLDAGEIDYRKVGTHRRIKAVSLLEYMRADDQNRRQAADELTALSQEMGLI